jgi:hypothetical protein
VHPSPFISFETRSSGSIYGVNKLWVRDMELVGVNSYHGAIHLVELSDFGPISTLENHIVIDLVPILRVQNKSRT